MICFCLCFCIVAAFGGDGVLLLHFDAPLRGAGGIFAIAFIFEFDFASGPKPFGKTLLCGPVFDGSIFLVTVTEKRFFSGTFPFFVKVQKMKKIVEGICFLIRPTIRDGKAGHPSHPRWVVPCTHVPNSQACGTESA